MLVLFSPTPVLLFHVLDGRGVYRQRTHPDPPSTYKPTPQGTAHQFAPLQRGVNIGSCHLAVLTTATVEECCDKCTAMEACVAFGWSTDGVEPHRPGSCLKDNTDPIVNQSNRASGIVTSITKGNMTTSVNGESHRAPAKQGAEHPVRKGGAHFCMCLFHFTPRHA